MKETKIIFSTPMVRAILEGRKNQTRRLKGLDKLNDPSFINDYSWKGLLDSHPDKTIHVIARGFKGHGWIETLHIKCPYGKVGDILWVREVWSPGSLVKYLYKAGETSKNFNAVWHPSIYMPKEACRLWLEITNIRVERLQDISEGDAKAEGVYSYGWDDHHQDDYKNYLYDDKIGDDWGVQTAKESYETLWESIHGKDSWDKNPWVWVIKFKLKDKV